MSRSGKRRFGLVGGGEGAFIGQVHRIAAELDGEAELVCGCFSADPAKSIRSGTALYGLDGEHCYASFGEMFEAESRRPMQQRMEFVVIATPNHMHFPVAAAALGAGFHVVCDKPVCISASEAERLVGLLRNSSLLFAVTYNYTGYPMVKEARQLIESGEMGSIRRVNCEYLQGWLATPQDADNKQAAWRTDPDRAGMAGCFGDIGSHAENLIRYVSGLEISEICADLSHFVPGRALDDDGNVLLRFEGGARGVLAASQIAVGRENDLKIEIFGTRGSLSWQQSDANSLVLRWLDRPLEVRRTGYAGIGAIAQQAARIPPGHPEGYLEAFANVYREFYRALTGVQDADHPDLDDGLAGMYFIEAVVASSKAGGSWQSLSGIQHDRA